MKQNIEKELLSINSNLTEESKEQYQNLKEQLDEIIECEVKGFILRSLCDDFEQGEKCTRYFFSLEKYKAKQKTISRLKLTGGSFTSDAKVILIDCHLFYKKLYSKNLNVDPNAYPGFFTNVTTPKLSETQGWTDLQLSFIKCFG